MGSDTEHTRAHIELAIERARESVGDTIDEIDQRLRERLDLRKMAAEHAPQLIATGAVLGFLIGYGVPRVVSRTLQLGVPIFLAVQIVRNRTGNSHGQEALSP